MTAYCANCGRELAKTARFCSSCGAPRGGAAAPTVIDEPRPAEADATAETPAPAPAPADAPPVDSAPTETPAPADAPPPRERPAPAFPAEPDPEPVERGHPGSAPPRPGADAPAPGSPQSPAPGGPQSPAPRAQQPPAPGPPPPAPTAPQSPGPGRPPPAPAAPQAPAPGPPPPPPAPGTPPPAGPQAPPWSQEGSSRSAGGGQTPPPLGDAAELARRLGAQARRPAVAAALAGGALAALVTVAIGLVMAVAFPDENSVIGALGIDASLMTETLRQSVSFLQVPFDGLRFPDVPEEVDLHGRVTPLLLLAVPVGACALAAALVLPRTRGSTTAIRLASCAGIALAFATLMLIAALAAGDASPNAAGAFFAALLWAGLGALVGAGVSLRREGAPMRLPATPPSAPEALGVLGRAVAASLRPLGVLLLVTAVLGTAAWVAYALIDEDTDEDRARTTVELALFGADHAVHFAELGAFVPFEPARDDLGDGAEATLPAPTSDPDELTGDESYRIFAYRDALPAYLFLPGVIVLIALPLMLALYGGFAAAGAAGATRSPGLSAAWGAVVGPVWAIAMAILDALATKPLEFSGFGRSAEITLFGSADGGGAFLFFLLVGGALGALGGLLAGSTGPDGRPAGVGGGG